MPQDPTPRTRRRASHFAESAPSTQPQPIDAPQENFQTLHRGQGAKLTTRKNAQQAAEIARDNARKRFNARHGGLKRAEQPKAPAPTKKIIGLVAGAFVVLCALFLLGRCIGSALDPTPDTSSNSTNSQKTKNQPESSADNTQADLGDSVTYQGVKYSIQQGEKGYELIQAQGTSSRPLFTIEGTPFKLIIANGTLFVPENKADGTWDVYAYMIGDSSLASKVSDADGQEVSGQGTISDAQADGETLTITTSDGTTTNISLN